MKDVKEKKKHTEELHAFKKMSISDSDQESINSSASKEGEIWKLGQDELFILILTIGEN